MAITKTNFINYTRCRRYVALEEVKKERLDADISYANYLEEEKKEKLSEMLSKMYAEDEDGSEADLIDVKNPQLEAMLPYYSKVEELAAASALKTFGGKVVSSSNTFNQECFDFSLNGIKYLCYVDVYNETKTNVNIIEVKATTSKKYMEVGTFNKEPYALFIKNDNIMSLKEETAYNFADEELKKYNKERSKLLDRYNLGKYVYDLSIQRYIIEGEYKESHNEAKLANFKYYLAVLNHEYVYDGGSEYEKDENGNEIITFIDMTKITKEMLPVIDTDRVLLEGYLKANDIESVPLGCFCEYKNPTECKYFKKVCGSVIPEYNSSLNYLNNGFGFKDENDEYHKGLNLINEGYIKMLDIPDTWIRNSNHLIQRNALITEKPYINKEKLKAVISSLKYPIYHLDFETFPCPIPRFKGEKCYEQSPFEFSLHIEREPGICDKEQDNYVFLATSFNDERDKLVKKLIELIDGNKGTLFAQNVSFEKKCIKRLGEIFPEYQAKLMKIYDRGFDLIDILKTKEEIYLNLGFDKETAKSLNYYDYHFSGSYSIKKTLPVFSNLSYKTLDVKNGTEAIVEYANYPHLTKEELETKRNSLIKYCQQDTWAMVVILDALRNIVK